MSKSPLNIILVLLLFKYPVHEQMSVDDLCIQFQSHSSEFLF